MNFLKKKANSKSNAKIFFIIPSLKGGGAEKILINLANHFSELKCNSIIVSLNSCLPAYIINKNVKVHYLLNRQNEIGYYRFYYMMITFFKLLYLIIKEKPACVLGFITSANLWVGITCNITNTAYIVSERTSPSRSINQLSYFGQRLVAFIYKRSSAVVVSCKGVEDCLIKNQFFKKLNNISRINNSVSKFGETSPISVHHRKFILAVGRLNYVKGFDQLISAFAEANVNNNIDLLIVGEGEERANLICQVYNLGLRNRVFLLGSKTNLQDYYSQCDLFVLASRNEGYPNVLVEAMSFGCPCVAVNCKFGPSEIIDNGKNGFLVQENNISELSNAISLLVNDDQLKTFLSKHAKEINNTNNAEAIMQKWEHLLLRHIC